jgi:hypothetical protein
MRLLLCVGPLNESSSVEINCGVNGGKCKMVYNRDSDPLHCIHCHSNKGAVTRHHTAIQFLPEALIEKLYPNDNVFHERTVGFKHSSSIPPVINEVFSNIIWEHGPNVIDLVITDPSSNTFNTLIQIRDNTRAYNTVNYYAALVQEKDKRLKNIFQIIMRLGCQTFSL